MNYQVICELPLSKANYQKIIELHQKERSSKFYFAVEDYFQESILKEAFKYQRYVYFEKKEKSKELVLKDNVKLSLANLSKFVYPTNLYYLNNFDYLKPLIQEMVSEKRYKHILSVADCCKELASHHHIDTHQAYLCGLLHDCLKDYSEEELDAYLKYYDPDKLAAPEPIKHGYACKYFLKENCNYYDKDLLNAIYHHSDGEANTKLARILYIADKREPLRKIDDNIYEISLKDLSLGFRLLKKDVERYLKEKNG